MAGMSDEQIAERVLEDVFKRAAGDRPSDVVPVAVFAGVTAYVARQVLPDDVAQAVNRRVDAIKRICNDKIAERQKTRATPSIFQPQIIKPS